MTTYQKNNYIATYQQQLMELQELYNSQQLLTAELSDRLEKTEVEYASVVKYRP